MSKDSAFDADRVFQKAKDGDLEPLGQHLFAMKPQLTQWAAKMTAAVGSALSPDDLFQDVMVRVLDDAASFRGHTAKAFGGWVFRIALRCEQNAARQRRTAKRRVGNIGSLDDWLMDNDVVDQQQPTADQLALEAEIGEKLAELKQRLGADDRMLFHLRRSGQSIAALAELFGWAPSTICKHLARIEGFLYLELRKCGFIDD
jgi:RNA polymerase sigma factor (sigma-70 family)